MLSDTYEKSLLERYTLCISSVVLLAAGLCFNIWEPLQFWGPESLMPGRMYAHHETVRFSVVLFGALLIPFVICWIKRVTKQREKPLDTLLVSVFAIALTNFIVCTLKFAIGKQRPDYADRVSQFTSGKQFLEATRSFPSGHSAVAFACAVLVAYSVWIVMHKYKHTARHWQLTIFGIVTPFLLASFVALSRIYDGRHDVVDVSAGVFIAIIVCVLTVNYLGDRQDMYHKWVI
ncbi:diacylglycerol diphosphate phosphatase / phosphatidate phosphatase [Nematocida homosporus]|uniref:diacylglycerol diphosphate phosphatase / phosphatidate phosphatase n=1 Tax=Nematocida homosporus TaxID=1912981 RepID=UPI00221EA511|nr:diacylglycerol diphosphate phosphatase / phosphatidate phosphatase [Nematocida homosporus]KAI5185100.1 diacylglycerol diphosphate phosphatase / phosphatidate phosphatase [Nematocida homosporus]